MLVQRSGSILLTILGLFNLQPSILSIAIHTKNHSRRSGRGSSLALSSTTKLPTGSRPLGNNPNEKLAFSVVPASTNPSNKFTKQLLEDILPNKLSATDTQLLDENNGGRLSFCISTETLNGLSLGQQFSPYGVKSLRLVVCECELPTDIGDNISHDTNALPSRQDAILEILELNLPHPKLPWKIYNDCFGNTHSTYEFESHRPNNLQVSCRRWASSCAISKKEFSSTNMKHALRRLLLRKYHSKKSLQRLDDCEFTLLLFKNRLRLEWTVLVPPKSKKFTNADYLPKPGCKRVEAWMLMKNLEQTVRWEITKRNAKNKNRVDKDEVIVLDPLCGKATFLVEAATTWNVGANGGVPVSFVGVDASIEQLRDAQLNVDAVTDIPEMGGNSAESRNKSSTNSCTLLTKRQTNDRTSNICLYEGDSRDLSLFGDGSVSAIATCPPFGRQFFALEKSEDSEDVHTKINPEISLSSSYRDWLREWTRILNPQNGRIALLVDVDHQKEALDAIAATGCLRVTVVREPFRLGRVRATVIVADTKKPERSTANTKNGATKTIFPDPLSRFPWEGITKESRAEWTRLRVASLQGLEPYSKVQREQLGT